MDPPQMPDEWTRRHARLGSLCRSLRDTNFHEWGFVIYRGVYGDDDAWNSYVQCLRDNIHLDLVRGNAQRGALLAQYAQWTIIEDSAALNGASTDNIRQHFLAWRQGRIVRRPGAPDPFPLPTDPSTILPRFSHCLYVDRACLATLGPHLAGKPADISRPHLPPPPLVAIVIDGEYVPGQQQDGDDQGGQQASFPPVEGSTARYLGWEYFDTRYLCGLYHDLRASRLDGYGYTRPPAIAPGGGTPRWMPSV